MVNDDSDWFSEGCLIAVFPGPLLQSFQLPPVAIDEGGVILRGAVDNAAMCPVPALDDAKTKAIPPLVRASLLFARCEARLGKRLRALLRMGFSISARCYAPPNSSSTEKASDRLIGL